MGPSADVVYITARSAKSARATLYGVCAMLLSVGGALLLARTFPAPRCRSGRPGSATANVQYTIIVITLTMFGISH